MDQRAKNLIVAVSTVAIVLGGMWAAYGALTPETASATVGAQTQIDGPAASGESPSGQVAAVPVTASGTVSWENMPDDVTAVRVSIMTVHDGETAVVAQENYTDVPNSQSGEYNFEQTGNLIANTPWEASDFSVDADGETQTREVEMAVTAAVIPGDEDFASYESTDYQTVTIEVTNTGNGSDGGSGGDGGNQSASLDAALSASVEMA